MNRITQTTVLTILILSIGAVSAEVIDDLDLDWFTIDSGGEMRATGGDLELSGTIGQPDAGVLAGADLELTGGFWGVASSTPSIQPGDGDGDGDGDIDLTDFSAFVSCFAGPGVATDAGCGFADFDDDGDVDLLDFLAFQVVYTGSK